MLAVWSRRSVPQTVSQLDDGSKLDDEANSLIIIIVHKQTQMILPTAANPNRRALTHHRRTIKGIIDIVMCRAAPPPSNDDGKSTNLRGGSLASALSFAPLPAMIANLASAFKPPYSVRRILLLLVLASFASLYAFHRGFQRTIQFWRGLAPLVIRYKCVIARANRIVARRRHHHLPSRSPFVC